MATEVITISNMYFVGAIYASRNTLDIPGYILAN